MPASVGAFVAQQEIMQDIVWLFFAVSLVIFLFVGYQISRYMREMTQIFSFRIERNRFPIRLRQSDVYHGLADRLNEAFEKFSGYNFEKDEK